MSMKSMESIMNNKYVSTTLTVIIILYISKNQVHFKHYVE